MTVRTEGGPSGPGMKEGVTAIFFLQLRYPWLDGFLAYTGMGSLPFAGRWLAGSLLLLLHRVQDLTLSESEHCGCRGEVGIGFYCDRY